MNDYFALPILVEAQAFGVRVALSGACVAAIVLLAARVLRRRSEPLRYGILFGGVIGLLVIPVLVGVCQCIPAAPAPVQEDIVTFPAEMLPELLNAPADEPDDNTASPSITGQAVGGVLLFAWMLGALTYLARLTWALRKQQHAIVGTLWHADFWTDELQAHLAQKLGLRRFPDVHLSPMAPMPMVIGIWRPVIVLPAEAPASWGQPQWEAVLLHEGAHIARRDPWAVLAQHVAVALFWWCPLVHLLGRRLNDLRENICDDYALQGPCDHFRYAELLIESAERLLSLKTIPIPLALLDSARGGLEARVTRLLEKERRPMTQLTMWGKLLAGSFLGVACMLTTAATAFPQAQPPKKVQIKVIIDGKEIDLGDLKILEHAEPTKTKPATDKPARPAGGRDAGVDNSKPIDKATVETAITPDGKVIVISDGKVVTWVDAQTGKVLQTKDAYAGVRETAVRALGAIGQPKPDPRIEELVKQAEAIKPGSGAEIRRALQGTPKAGDYYWRAYVPHPAAKAVPPVPPVPPMPPGVPQPMARPLPVPAGTKVIIVIEDGKVRQLTEQELKKLTEPGLRFQLELDLKKKTTDFKSSEKAISDLLQNLPKGIAVKPAPPPPPTAPDVEALRRQLDRINADLQDLRKHLEAKKK